MSYLMVTTLFAPGIKDRDKLFQTSLGENYILNYLHNWSWITRNNCNRFLNWFCVFSLWSQREAICHCWGTLHVLSHKDGVHSYWKLYSFWLPYAHDLKSCSVCLFETVLSGQDSVNLKTYYPSRVQNTFERPTVAVFLTQITIIINYSLVHLLCAKGCNKSSAYTSFIHHEKVHNVFLLWPYYRSLLKTEA